METLYSTALLVAPDEKDIVHFINGYEAANNRKFSIWEEGKDYKDAFIHLPIEMLKDRTMGAMNLLLHKRHHRNHIVITTTVNELLKMKNKNAIWYKDFVTLFGTVALTDDTMKELPIIKQLKK